MEEEILAWWEKERVFEKLLKAGKQKKEFVFYEGPPTANGMPHPGHVLGRCFKDLFLRYKSMQGYHVPRRAGWDTHGLPVEIEIEKKLGITKKSEIEKFGVREFNKLCKESVWKYKDEWERMTKRIGFWLDMSDPYVTYEAKYMETLWWVIRHVFDKGLLVQDYKVMQFCTRCGTGLSSHEIAQGYKTIKDKSVYLKFKVKDEPATFFLVWTTTPWTLPANVALAVNPKNNYIKVTIDKIDGEISFLKEGESYIFDASVETQSRILGDYVHVQDEFFGDAWIPENQQKIHVTFKNIKIVIGKELAGMRYERPFPYMKADKDAFFVITADFVTATDGSGIVHIAPAYGEDDMAAAKKHDLPVLHPVQENGEFIAAIPWQNVFVKDADPAIVENLKERNLFFKEETYEHEYPFCWRCDTPILYYARKSWFIKMASLKDELVKRNKTITWVPEHIQEGRFGEWLAQVKDWAFSRERYWGTPLPIWRCDACGHTDAVGSVAELGERSQLKNQYFMMRHGQAMFNVKNVTETSGRLENLLTKKGTKEAKESLVKFTKKYKGMVPDVIIASPFPRAQETARIAAEHFGIARERIVTEPMIKEVHVGIFDGKPAKQYHAYFSSYEEKFTKQPPEGETLTALRGRMAAFIQNAEKRYEGKTIFIVSHEYPLWMLETALLGHDVKESAAAKKKKGNDYIKTGEIRALPRMRLPLDENGFLDLHKPHIDDIVFTCLACETGTMRRIPEVCDVWFDSGAMPFAQNQNFDIKQIGKKHPYPADLITEGVDQTRGWFYTLLAVATLLGQKAPYRAAVSQGHILDKHGKKMSKSKKNYTDPLIIADKYGIDALRWYFFVVSPVGEPKKFDEKDVLDAQRKSVTVLFNIAHFLSAYAAKGKGGVAKLPVTLKNPLDTWVVSRLHETIAGMTKAMDRYDALVAARQLGEYLDDMTNWYIRRSRERFQLAEDKADYRAGVATLEYVFEQTLKLAAPFIPFSTERLWQTAKKKGSIHMQAYPRAEKKRIDKRLQYAMIQVRETVSSALKKRAEAGIKVRQPLGTITISKKIPKTLLVFIRDEVNVKEVIVDSALKEDMMLDTTLTQELREEGMIREIMRHIQQARKDTGLTKKDVVTVQYATDEVTAQAIAAWEERMKQRVVAEKIERVAGNDLSEPRVITGDGYAVKFVIIHR